LLFAFSCLSSRADQADQFTLRLEGSAVLLSVSKEGELDVFFFRNCVEDTRTQRYDESANYLVDDVVESWHI
jgi:hypothetical protein